MGSRRSAGRSCEACDLRRLWLFRDRLQHTPQPILRALQNPRMGLRPSSRLLVPFALAFFRAARGHQYVLPDSAVRPFDGDYGDGRHDMLGYMKSMEWLRDNPQGLSSMYQYGRG